MGKYFYIGGEVKSLGEEYFIQTLKKTIYFIVSCLRGFFCLSVLRVVQSLSPELQCCMVTCLENMLL